MSKSRVFFRVIVGGYLAYLGAGLVKDAVTEQPDNYILYAAMGIVFLVIGVVWCGLAIQKIIRHEYVDDNYGQFDDEDDDEEEEKPEISENSDHEETDSRED